MSTDKTEPEANDQSQWRFPQVDGRLLTVKQAAEYIHETMTEATIRTAIHQKRLSAIRSGRRFYIRDQAAVDYMKLLEDELQSAPAKEPEVIPLLRKDPPEDEPKLSGQAIVDAFLEDTKKNGWKR